MFSELLLRDARPELSQDDGRTVMKVHVRLNWYRSVPLSCVEEIDLRLDGSSLINDQATLTVGSQLVPLGELSSREDVWWFPLDQALLTMPLTLPLERGRTHVLTYWIRTRIPYFPPRPDGTWGTLNDLATTDVRL